MRHMSVSTNGFSKVSPEVAIKKFPQHFYNTIYRSFIRQCVFLVFSRNMFDCIIRSLEELPKPT